MGQKGHMIVQKGLKMHESGIFLSGFGGYPPPLTDHFCAQKNLAGRGGTPPLMDKIR